VSETSTESNTDTTLHQGSGQVPEGDGKDGEERCAFDARQWIHDHPASAILIALGTGLVAGRLVSSAFRSAEPVQLTARERMRERAELVASRAKDLAGSAGDQASRAVVQARHGAGEAWGHLGHFASGAQDVGVEWLSSLGDAVQQGFARGISKRIADWIESLNLPSR
jgi:hypothetical protein